MKQTIQMVKSKTNGNIWGTFLFLDLEKGVNFNQCSNWLGLLQPVFPMKEVCGSDKGCPVPDCVHQGGQPVVLLVSLRDRAQLKLGASMPIVCRGKRVMMENGTIYWDNFDSLGPLRSHRRLSDLFSRRENSHWKSEPVDKFWRWEGWCYHTLEKWKTRICNTSKSTDGRKAPSHSLKEVN